MSRFLCALLVAPLCLAQLCFSEEISREASSQLLNELLRPQEPRRPYPYDEEEVGFINKAAGITLAGTLTLPRTQGPFPAVILLHGSAPLDRDSSLFGHKFFLVWADYLTRHGIAVLRFDKRSAGKSTGNYNTSTIQDFASDAVTAVEYLKTRQEINIKQIGLIGHSEGGMTASLAASTCSDIAFIVLMAAPYVNGEETVFIQEALFQRADGVDEKTILQSRKLRKQFFSILKAEKNSEIAAQKLRDALEVYLGKATPSERKITEAYYGPKEKQIELFNSAWFRYWLTYDPTFVLKQIKVPILALNGETDLFVPVEQNLKRLALTLKETKHKDYTIVQLPKLNHVFQTCEIGSMSECANITETTSPIVLSTISEWILARTAEKK